MYVIVSQSKLINLVGLTVTSYKETFPQAASQVLASKLTKNELFPESIIPSSEIVSFLRTSSLLTPSHSVLLAQQLWCTLGDIRVAQGKIKFAELCEHEAFILNELDPQTYVLKGRIQMAMSKFQTALECFQLGLQVDPNNVECLLGCAQCYLEIDSLNNLHLALYAATRATEIDPQNVSALSMCGDLSRRLNLDRRAGEIFTNAMTFEKDAPLIPVNNIFDLVMVSASLLQ